MTEFRKSRGRFVYYNRNPRKLKHACDCVTRAISAATALSWEDTMRSLVEHSIEIKYAFNAKEAYSSWLEENGWTKHKQPRKPNGRKYRLHEFLNETTTGMFLVNTRGHLTFVEDGYVYDTFNCLNEVVGNYWSPPKNWLEHKFGTLPLIRHGR